jgi:hypothetical protein
MTAMTVDLAGRVAALGLATSSRECEVLAHHRPRRRRSESLGLDRSAP